MVWAEEGHVDIVLCTGWLSLEYSRVLLLKTSKQKPAFLRTVLSGPVYYTGSVVQEALSPVWNCIFQSHYFWRVPFSCLIWDTCLWQHFWFLARFTDKASHRPETCGTKEPGCRVHGSHLSFRHRLARGALFPIHPGACKPVSARREQLQGFHSQSLKPWPWKEEKGLWTRCSQSQRVGGSRRGAASSDLLSAYCWTAWCGLTARSSPNSKHMLTFLSRQRAAFSGMDIVFIVILHRDHIISLKVTQKWVARMLAVSS